MPILESTDKLAPRSALRHRPIADDTLLTEQIPGVTKPIVKRASRVHQVDTGDEVTEWKRVGDDGHTGGASTPMGARQTTGAKAAPTKLLPKAGKAIHGAHIHPLLYLGVGMLAMLAMLAIISAVTNWFTTMLDDMHYGRPRTFQIDAYVGHTESPGIPSHFIALNLHGHIEVIEFPGGDATHARVYLGPQLYGPGADLVPVTLSFADVNGDHLPDMIIHFQGTQIVFINDQGKFRPLRPGERGAAEQSLQRIN